MLEILFQSVGVLPRHASYVLPVIGPLAALLSLFAFAPYIRDTQAGRTRPQRASWFIWSVLCAITLCSQIYEGATTSLWFVAVQAVSTMVIFGLSIRHGTGSFINRSDGGMMLAAAFGLVLWGVTDTTEYALVLVILVSSLGGIATIRKAYADPGSETMSTWVLSFGAAGLAILAVDEPSVVFLAYPAYLFVLYGIIALTTRLGRARKPQLAMAPILWPRETGVL